jgi:diguanylate cyclase (GGDEF)-like protein
MQSASTIISEETLASDEARINRFVWASRVIAFVLTAAVVAFFLAAEASRLWQFIVYPLAAALPFLYGIVSARYIRLMHVDLLRRYQAQLTIRTIELEKMASHDELTQLYNRRHFYERFREELEHAQTNRQSLALILLDIDGLKAINDEHGHTVGDIMIGNLARVIEKHTRASDVPARLGGDEFAILMPDTDKRGAFSFAERIWEELERTPMFEHEGLSVLLAVSIGVSGFPWGGEDTDEMMHWADADMYANKVSRRLPQAAAAPQAETTKKDPRLESLDWT